MLKLLFILIITLFSVPAAAADKWERNQIWIMQQDADTRRRDAETRAREVDAAIARDRAQARENAKEAERQSAEQTLHYHDNHRPDPRLNNSHYYETHTARPTPSNQKITIEAFPK